MQLTVWHPGQIGEIHEKLVYITTGCDYVARVGNTDQMQQFAAVRAIGHAAPLVYRVTRGGVNAPQQSLSVFFSGVLHVWLTPVQAVAIDHRVRTHGAKFGIAAHVVVFIERGQTVAYCIVGVLDARVLTTVDRVGAQRLRLPMFDRVVAGDIGAV